MRMPQEWVTHREFSLAISLLRTPLQACEIQKPQGPSENTGRSALADSPTHQKRFQHLVHLVERICTKKDRLVVSGIVNVIRGYFEIQWSQLGLVHLCELSGRGQ